MIEVRITNWMYEKAKELAKKDKQKFGTDKNTILDIYSDDTRLVGKLGEVVISCYFNIPLTNTRDFDIIINQDLVEIKSMKINGIPKPYYLCSIFGPKKGCDRYIFVIVHSSYTKAWIVGTRTKDEFEHIKHYGCPLMIDRKVGPDYVHTKPRYFLLVNEWGDIDSWQSKFGRTAKAYGLMRRQADL